MNLLNVFFFILILILKTCSDDYKSCATALDNSMSYVVIAGGDYSVPYLDVKDAQWKCEGELLPVDIRDISAAQFVIYRFGVFVAKLMEELSGAPEVSILLASKLPHNNYVKNAYR